MTALLCEPEAAPAYELFPPSNDQVRAQVWNVLAAVYPSGRFVERRSEQRYPYPRLITLWPMDAEGKLPAAPPMTVVGKHLSERGLGFFHPQPLAARLVVVSLEKGDGRAFSFLLDVHRCRFTRQGWYESGGRLLAAVEPPTKCFVQSKFSGRTRREDGPLVPAGSIGDGPGSPSSIDGGAGCNPTIQVGQSSRCRR